MKRNEDGRQRSDEEKNKTCGTKHAQVRSLGHSLRQPSVLSSRHGGSVHCLGKVPTTMQQLRTMLRGANGGINVQLPTEQERRMKRSSKRRRRCARKLGKIRMRKVKRYAMVILERSRIMFKQRVGQKEGEKAHPDAE